MSDYCKEKANALIAVQDVKPWTCAVCGELIMQDECHEHTAAQWRSVGQWGGR